MITQTEIKDREAQVDTIVANARTRNDFHGSIKATPEYKKPSFTGRIRKQARPWGTISLR